MCFCFLCLLIIFSISPPLLPLASFIRMSVGEEKCNHETRRRDAARGNMFAVDKHSYANCRAFRDIFNSFRQSYLHENT